ncbi:hypothetical protein HKX48_000812 [Thoreauomyces humboldtii]|nr:hypothetical protein HKX48_000812 [Thoreauomyces humboldtii]
MWTYDASLDYTEILTAVPEEAPSHEVLPQGGRWAGCPGMTLSFALPPNVLDPPTHLSFGLASVMFQIAKQEDGSLLVSTVVPDRAAAGSWSGDQVVPLLLEFSGERLVTFPIGKFRYLDAGVIEVEEAVLPDRTPAVLSESSSDHVEDDDHPVSEPTTDGDCDGDEALKLDRYDVATRRSVDEDSLTTLQTISDLEERDHLQPPLDGWTSATERDGSCSPDDGAEAEVDGFADREDESEYEDDRDETPRRRSLRSTSRRPARSGDQESTEGAGRPVLDDSISAMANRENCFNLIEKTFACAFDRTQSELDASRRIVRVARAKDDKGSGTVAVFKAVQNVDDLHNGDMVVSCMYWPQSGSCWITSVEYASCIQLLECIFDRRFTTSEKNRIRRLMETSRPVTVSKGNRSNSGFYAQVMGYPEPRPRKIDKDIKVFEWGTLRSALEKIIRKEWEDGGV